MLKKPPSLRESRFELLSAFVLSVSIFFFAPVYLYLNNIQANSMPFAQLWYLYLGITVAAFLLLFLTSYTLLLLTGRHFMAWIFLILSICILVQGFYLNVDIGRLDGQSVDFSKLKRASIIDGLVWAAIIAVIIAFRKKIQNSKMFILGLLLVAECSLIAFSLLPNISALSKQNAAKNDQSLFFRFSSRQNVIVLILDAFPAQLFSDMLDNPLIGDEFKDFTFFENAMGMFPTTKPSIPYLMSGIPYDNQEPFETYLSDQKIKPIQRALSERGFETRYYSFIPFGFGKGWDFVQTIGSGSPQTEELVRQYLLSFTRFLPNIFKQPMVEMYYSGMNYYHKDIKNFLDWSSTAQRADSQPVFQLFHVTGAHPPFQLDENFLFHKEGTTREQQATAALSLAANLIEQLKEIKVYDDSLIIIMADHGHLYSSPGQAYQDAILEFARPLMMVKYPRSTQNQLAKSSLPVRTGDAGSYITSYLDSGKKLDSNYEVDQAPRPFYYYIWQHADWNQPFMPPMMEFQVSGDVKDKSSWILKGVLPPNTREYKYLPVRLGEDVFSFWSDPQYQRNFLNMVRDNPNGGPFGVSPSSCILGEYEGKFPVALVVKGKNFLNPAVLEKQKIRIHVNSSVVYDSNFSNDLSIPLTDSVKSEDNHLFICFEFPDAVSPAEVSESSDKRLLAYQFESLSIQPVHPEDMIDTAALQKPGSSDAQSALKLPQQYSFTSEAYDPASGVLLSGWSQPETKFVWSADKKVELSFRFPPPERDVIVTLDVFPFRGGNQIPYQRVFVSANRSSIQEWTVLEQDQLVMTIPKDLVPDGKLTLELSLPNLASPKSLGMSDDPRLLAIGLIQATIELKP